MQNLVIVESPAKAKTIKKYLGSSYEVVASMGHIRDLPAGTLAVDIKNDFEPKYSIIKEKRELVKEIKEKAKACDNVYLATDPDREGEAISWHLANILGIDSNKKARVTFNEITKNGIKTGMDNPREIDLDLVNAQQARRILDRLVGYKLSPFISKKIHRGLSAGRVQSVALRLLCDREEEIEKFVPEEYWSIEADLLADKMLKAFHTNLSLDSNGKKIKLSNEDEAKKVLADLDNATYTVKSIKEGTRQKKAAPPFNTSTLQQEASKRLGFQARRTMKTAQELYEGVDIKGEGRVGLITYMRTDSLRISEEALTDVRNYIKTTYGEKYIPEKAIYYKTNKSAQDGHEAIRPTDVSLHPSMVKTSVTLDQYKLYKLVWERFVACQMSSCVQKTKKLDIDANTYTFSASGYTVAFDGFTVLYDNKDDDDENEKALPNLKQGDVLELKSIEKLQHFTQPPARFTEASLIKELEENGIGRPSTYAAIITTITSRDYCTRESKSLVPTDLGKAVTKLMVLSFPKIVDVSFTSHLEEDLDKIQLNSLHWTDCLHTFYDDFVISLKEAEEKTDGQKITLERDNVSDICPNCGKPMAVKYSKYGRFIACTGYPECKTVKKIVNDSGVLCPKCGGKILIKKTKSKKTFYGCENYPKCDFASWDEPLNEKCPECKQMLFRKLTGKKNIYCANKECTYKAE